MGGGSPQPFGRGREEIGNETSSLQDGASPAKPLPPLPRPELALAQGAAGFAPASALREREIFVI